MRVLHVIGGVGPGGAETLMYRLVTRPSPVRHEVICMGDEDWYSEPLRASGITVHYLKVRSVSTGLRAVLRLWRLIRSIDADVVQGWMYRSNLLGSLGARMAGKPSVWSIHCASLEPLSRSARNWVYASGAVARWVPDFIVNCSRRSAAMHAGLGFDRARGAVIPNGYATEAFKPDPEARKRVRDSLGIREDEFLVGAVSRWHPEKDIPNLLAALGKVRDRGTPVRCLLVGHELTPENPLLTQAIADRGLEEIAIPLGRRADVAAIMSTLDVHVLPSRSEAFPNVVGEAMLCATPCIVTDVGDAAYMVGETGWTAPPQSPDALAGRIVEARALWEADGQVWDARRQAARARIADNFSLQQMAAGYEEVWRSVAGEAAQAPGKPRIIMAESQSG
ncbi:MAG TPA: glycosyltransferase [Allosphingosinicella sp.]